MKHVYSIVCIRDGRMLYDNQVSSLKMGEGLVDLYSKNYPDDTYFVAVRKVEEVPKE